MANISAIKLPDGNTYDIVDNNKALPATSTPLIDDTGAVGTSTKFAREDHEHPQRITFERSNEQLGQGYLYTIVDNATGGDSGAFYDDVAILTGFAEKVDKVSGKDLSTNDFTDALQTKLNGIETGAEVNVQANWTESSSSSDAYIKNKPTLGTASGLAYETSLSASADNKLPTSKAVATYVGNAITGAASFQGTAPTTFAPTNYKKGWYWVVGTAGTYVGETCEAGDMIFAIEDYSSAYSASDFEVIQTNLDITSISNGEIDTIVSS